MAKINLRDYPSKVLEAGDKYSFDSGDHDLNEFFHVEAIPHKRELIGVTYFFYDDFTFLSEKDARKQTRAMKFDLKQYINISEMDSYANR